MTSTDYDWEQAEKKTVVKCLECNNKQVRIDCKYNNNNNNNNNELAHDKTYNKICMTSRDSDQPVRQPNLAKVLIYPFLDRLEAVEGTCNQ